MQNEASRRHEIDRFLVEKNPAVVCVLGRDGTIEYANPTVLGVLGQEPASIVGRSILEIVHPSDQRALSAQVVSAFECPGCVFRRSHRMRHTGETWRALQVLVKVETDSAGEERGILQAEALEEIGSADSGSEFAERPTARAQRLEALGSLVPDVVHDFNSFLQVIVGESELSALVLEDPERVGKSLACIRKSALRAARLAKTLLHYGRSDHGEELGGSWHEAVGEAMELLQRRLREGDVQLLRRSDERRVRIRAEAGELTQVVLNLATNALDAMEDSHRILSMTADEVSCAEFDETLGCSSTPCRSFARLVVADTGVGMDEATLERAREPFFSTKTPDAGTGLGLTIAARIVTALGGRMTIESTPMKGTIVTVLVPSGEDSNGRPVPQDSTEDLKGDEVALVVEPDPEAAGSASDQLRSLGYTVVSARNGCVAVQRFLDLSDAFDVLVTTAHPGRVDGLDLVHRARVLRPDLGVVLLAERGEELPEEQLERLGFPGLLRRPQGMRELGLAVRDAVRGRVAVSTAGRV